MKYLAILVGACLCLGGCIIETTSGSDNSGGNGGEAGGGVGGGTGGDTTTGGTAGMGTGGTAGEGGTAGGGGMGGGCPEGMCVSCAEAVTPGLNDLGCPTCDGESTELYDAFVDCLCNGACMAACGDNVCTTGDMPSDECTGCIADTVSGCGNEFETCSGDAG